MPHSLCILADPHNGVITYDFLLRNESALQHLGYNQILFSISNSNEPSIFFSSLKKGNRLFRKNFVEKLIAVYENFNASGFTCRFINPESLNVSFDNSRKEPSDSCSEAMVSSILTADQSSRPTGGIIFIGNFLDRKIIQKLKEATARTPYPFRYVIFDNQSNLGKWSFLKDDRKRANYYGTQAIKHIDLSEEPSFEMIIATLQLLPADPLADTEQPTIAKHLREATDLPFQFLRDSKCIVSASLEIDNSEEQAVASSLRSLFPRLRFFTQKMPDTPEKSTLCIPGINLNEQQEGIAKSLLSRPH